MGMTRLIRFGLVALLGSLVVLGSAAQERILIKPGAKEANLRRTWKRYVAFTREHPTYAEHFFCKEWHSYHPVFDPEIRQALRTKCAERLTEEGFGTQTKTITLLLLYRGYYYVAVDWGFEDLTIGTETIYRRRFYWSDPLHLYAFDENLNHVASFHEGGFVEERFTVKLAFFQFSEAACENGQSPISPAPLGELRPDYPPAAMALGLSGEVKVSGTIQPDGRVSELNVLERSNVIFIQSTLSALENAEFEPGRCGERAISTPFTITFSFRSN